MPENPEQVLPEVGFPAFQEIVKVSAVVAVEHQFHQGDGDGGKREDDEKTYDKSHPAKHGHPHHGHTGGAHVDESGDEVERGEKRGQAQDLNAEYPKVRSQVASNFLKPYIRERRIGKPTDSRGATREEPAHVKYNGACYKTPKTKSVQSWKRNVSGPNLQGHYEIKESGA